MNQKLNLPEVLFNITGTFEYELLIELILRHWQHPFATDENYRNEIMESVALLLSNAAKKKFPIDDMQQNEVNLVFALWYIESLLVINEQDVKLKKIRQQWLSTINHALPSCFCDQDLLDSPV